MLLARLLIAPYPQVDILGFHLVEEGEDGVTPNDLPIEVEGLESLELCVAKVTIKMDVLGLAELFKLFRVDVVGRREQFLVFFFGTFSEKVSIDVRVHIATR